MKRVLILTIILSLNLFACGDNEPKQPTIQQFEFPISVKTFNAEGEPVVQVPVFLDEKLVGHTDATGTFAGVIVDYVSSPITLGVKPPEGWVVTSQEESVSTQLTIQRVIDGIQAVPVDAEFTLATLEEDYLIWVKADCKSDLPDGTCAGLDVRLGDKVVAKTDALGHAHFSIRSEPGETIRVRINTPEPDRSNNRAPIISPANPTYEIALDLGAHIYLVEESFENLNPTTRRVQRLRPRPRPKARPAAPKEEPAPGSITLW